MPSWASTTTTSVAPPSNAPAMAAFASAVIHVRARSWSSPLAAPGGQPVAVSRRVVTPEMPSMSTEMRIFTRMENTLASRVGRSGMTELHDTWLHPRSELSITYQAVVAEYV